MSARDYDIVIVGGGAGGLAAAKSASGNARTLLIEREAFLGGILNQCIHHGFGLHHYNEELTGPEYAVRIIEDIEDGGVDILLETTVKSLKKEDGLFCIGCSNVKRGPFRIRAKAVVLASGSFERTAGQIELPGERPAGILTAGRAQRYLNIEGYLVGKRVVVLGSGDIGLIMARRMTLEGARVEAVVEIMAEPSGLTRNIVQCLHDFDIPLLLSHSVTGIEGKKRLERVRVAEVDQSFSPVKGTEKVFDVDTLLLSVGLLPDYATIDGVAFATDKRTNGPVVDDAFQTSVPGLFVCGNALHIHDIVDFVTEEGLLAGKTALRYVREKNGPRQHAKDVVAGKNVRYVVPQRILFPQNLDIPLSLRVERSMSKGTFRLRQGGRILKETKKSFLTPSEMVRLEMPGLDRSDSGPLEIELLEDGR